MGIFPASALYYATALAVMRPRKASTYSATNSKSQQRDLNPQQIDYKSITLPIESCWQFCVVLTHQLQKFHPHLFCYYSCSFHSLYGSLRITYGRNSQGHDSLKKVLFYRSCFLPSWCIRTASQ